MKDKPKVRCLAAPEIGTRTDVVPTEIRKQFPEESSGLGCWGNDQFVVGLTPGVNDESAQLVDAFTPTRFELGVLARHYLDAARDIELWWDFSEQVGSSETREKCFAYARLDTIEKLLGTEEFEGAISETLAKWNEKFREQEKVPRCDECGTRHHGSHDEESG